MDTALPQKLPFILDRNLAKANCAGNRVCTSCDTVVLCCNPFNDVIATLLWIAMLLQNRALTITFTTNYYFHFVDKNIYIYIYIRIYFFELLYFTKKKFYMKNFNILLAMFLFVDISKIEHTAPVLQCLLLGLWHFFLIRGRFIFLIHQCIDFCWLWMW